ncbi:hypothetical protein GCK72_016500 [Caenorhabditis remanei]|uniref:Uncharacterized protein n=1 Tax=Caenorhabditis remanei TaxID=31234 RepID=A0A6A5G5L3_CAERE|nr:hypothetical protein GCK72_016500 [Caenorhabditis remanei]KAF1749955.1 hypothetical protein GCK72_016500 [Caenorhabditis remanei]
MLLNLLTISALVGLTACGAYQSNDNYAAAANPGYAAYYQPPRHYRRDHWRKRSSSESDEKWDCKRIGVFNVSNANAPLFFAPKIAYYTKDGKEKAIVVCPNPQIQLLVGKSRNANKDTLIPADKILDYPLISVSSKSGLTLDCKERKHRYEAFNLLTGKNVPLEAVACITATPADTMSVAGFIIAALQDGGFNVGELPSTD